MQGAWGAARPPSGGAGAEPAASMQPSPLRLWRKPMRIVIIGGSGHVGTYLVPRLISAGHAVIAISRGQREPYQPHAAWQSVQQIVADRDDEEAAGTFGARVRDLQPDVVIDMICFTLESARQLVVALHGQVQHVLHCG